MDLHCCPFHILWLLAGNASRDGCTCLGTATPAVWMGGGGGGLLLTPNKKMLLKHVANCNHSKLLSTPCLAHRTCIYVYVCVVL